MCFAVAIGGALAELALAWIWLHPASVERFVIPHLGISNVALATDGATRALGFAISMLPLGVMLYALQQAYAVFDGFRRGETISSAQPGRLENIGCAMLALAVLRPLAHCAVGLAMTYSNPPGARIVAIALDIGDVMLAIFGGLVIAIAFAMTEAARIADDHRQII